MTRIHSVTWRSGDYAVDERVDRLMFVSDGVWDTVKTHANVDADLWALDTLMLLQTVDHGTRFHQRSMAAIRRDQFDQYRVALAVERGMVCDAAGTRRVLMPGQILFTDLAQPEWFETERSTMLMLMIPRRALDDLLPRPVDLHGWMPQGAAAMLIGDHMRAMARAVPLLLTREVPGINQATLHLLAAAIAPNVGTLGNAREAIACVLLRQVQRYIEAHLTSPELSVEKICGAVKVSRATVYRLFELHGGIAHYIRTQRLQRAHQQLAASTQRITLERLADQLGFNGASNLSRAFRAHFGYSPSEVGKQGLRQLPTAVTTQAGGASFRDYIRRSRHA